jgi:hypothetical protein
MKIRTSQLLIGIAVLLTNVSSLFAQVGPINDKLPIRPEMGIPDLTDQQKEKIKNLDISHFKELQPVRNEMMELKAHFKTISSVENPNMTEIYKNIDARTALLNKMMKMNFSHQQEIRKLLTDEQKIFLDMKPFRKVPGKFGKKPGPGPDVNPGNKPGKMGCLCPCRR